MRTSKAQVLITWFSLGLVGGALPAIADSRELAPVAVTFAMTKKESQGAVYPRNAAGKEDRTQPVTDWVEYSVTDSKGTKNYEVSGRKSASYKIGNAEIIRAIQEEWGGLPDGTVSGWKIMALPTVDLEEGAVRYEVYVQKSGQSEVPLCTILVATEMTNTGSRVVTKNTQGEVTSVVITGSATYETAVRFSVMDDPTLITGLFTGSVKVETYLSDPLDKNSVTPIGVPGACKIASVIAADEEGNPITGSITFAASKAVKPAAQ
jgi:hypothetical protein